MKATRRGYARWLFFRARCLNRATLIRQRVPHPAFLLIAGNVLWVTVLDQWWLFDLGTAAGFSPAWGWVGAIWLLQACYMYFWFQVRTPRRERDALYDGLLFCLLACPGLGVLGYYVWRWKAGHPRRPPRGRPALFFRWVEAWHPLWHNSWLLLAALMLHAFLPSYAVLLLEMPTKASAFGRVLILYLGLLHLGIVLAAGHDQLVRARHLDSAGTRRFLHQLNACLPAVPVPGALFFWMGVNHLLREPTLGLLEGLRTQSGPFRMAGDPRWGRLEAAIGREGRLGVLDQVKRVVPPSPRPMTREATDGVKRLAAGKSALLWWEGAVVGWWLTATGRTGALGVLVVVSGLLLVVGLVGALVQLLRSIRHRERVAQLPIRAGAWAYFCGAWFLFFMGLNVGRGQALGVPEVVYGALIATGAGGMAYCLLVILVRFFFPLQHLEKQLDDAVAIVFCLWFLMALGLAVQAPPLPAQDVCSVVGVLVFAGAMLCGYRWSHRVTPRKHRAAGAWWVWTAWAPMGGLLAWLWVKRHNRRHRGRP